MVTGFVILGLVVLAVALVVKKRDPARPGEKPPRVGRAGIVPNYGRSSHRGTNGSSVGLLGLGGFGAGGFDGGSCGTSDGGSGGGDSGGGC